MQLKFGSVGQSFCPMIQRLRSVCPKLPVQTQTHVFVQGIPGPPSESLLSLSLAPEDELLESLIDDESDELLPDELEELSDDEPLEDELEADELDDDDDDELEELSDEDPQQHFICFIGICYSGSSPGPLSSGASDRSQHRPVTSNLHRPELALR